MLRTKAVNGAIYDRSSVIVQATTVAMVINCDCNTFIVQAIGASVAGFEPLNQGILKGEVSLYR
jgi:hypothetical protein